MPGAGAPAPDEAAERRRRWQAVQDHPVVKELLKRFTADVISREFLPKDDWLRRFGG